MTAHACTALPLADVSGCFTLTAGDTCPTFVPLLAHSRMRAHAIGEWWRALPFNGVDLVQVHGGPVGTYSLGGEVRELPSMTVTAEERNWVRPPGISVEKL